MKFLLSGKKEQVPFKISYREGGAKELLSFKLLQLTATEGFHLHDCIVICIGTDRSTGDALGPLVGTRLVERNAGIAVYGTLDEPVHALNLQETLDVIASRYDNPRILAIDACLGQLSSVGCIQLCSGPVMPGAGVNKKLPPVGDVHMTGIVNVGGFMEYFVLQNTRLSLVFQMADVMASAILHALSWSQQAAVLPSRMPRTTS